MSARLSSRYKTADASSLILYSTVADGILDRLVHNAYRIDMKGESMWKEKAVKTEC